MLQSTACEFDHTCDLESRINSISIMGIMQTDVTDAPPAVMLPPCTGNPSSC
jgi:hypothetical protein